MKLTGISGAPDQRYGKENQDGIVLPEFSCDSSYQTTS